ncbi:von Willebrand factor type A domain protein [Planctomycetes bacterium Pan216]|uniref:von Willebrand factor type A domain protein n=1 Tax=Kolteria novifilia TaxID=2527975 RepID=A0A518B3A0_9BACT|nr:von Willebrand factor type A domain protein [Planctomycetes bacterium Pan216]
MSEAWLDNPGFEFELTRPWWLLGLVALPILYLTFRHSLVDFPRWQRRLSLVVRSLVVALLVLSLSGLALLTTTRELFVVFVLDKSLSVADSSREQAAAFVDRAVEEAGSNRVAFLSFGQRPGAIRSERIGETEAPPERGTDIAEAITVATAAMPPFYVPRIVLLSDGNETAGDSLTAALHGGVPISTVMLETRSDPEVQVSSVDVPAQVAQGEPFHVEVLIDSNHDDEGLIEVYNGAIKVVGERRKIQKGANRFRFRQSIDSNRLAEFTVRISGFDDTLVDNNTHSGLVFTTGKPRVLLIESEPSQIRDLTWALEEEDIAIETRPPVGMPESLADLQNFELLILSNVPATSLTAKQMEVARSYVQDLGGGLIMLGGDQSFGLGGYYKSILEEVLPVRSDFEKEKEKPSLAMVLVIDKSGSMGGQKIELAKEAAKSAVDLLGPSDKIGVIAFDGQSYWVVDVRPVSDKSTILERISTIEAGGGTTMYPAMEEAYLALGQTVAKLKHVIVMTDGISSPGDFVGLAETMALERITLSTVGVGDGCDEVLLEDIARTGRGRYYFTNDPQSIPQIFAKETVTASKSAINEEPFIPQVIRPTPVLSEVDIESAPFLLGYVVTRPKPTSEFILATESGDPLLAWWRYGLGMSVAFTSDAKSRWAAEWLSWPGFGKFWAQLIRHAMRKSDSKGVVVKTTRKDGHTKVVMDAVDPAGRFVNRAETELTVIRPDLANEQLTMRQTAPGRYVGHVKTDQPGAYHLRLTQRRDGSLAHQQTRGTIVGYPEELRLRPPDEQRLEAIARATGGIHQIDSGEVFATPTTTAKRAFPLWSYLITAALSLFLVDVALRRIDWSLVLVS